MNIDNKLDLLKQIKEVDAPPYLLTRIRQQMQNTGAAQAPIKWKWAFAFAAIFILALNISIFLKTSDNNNQSENGTKKAGLENVIKSMNLTTTNELYHE